MASRIILKSFTIVLRSTVLKAGTSMQSVACYSNLLCKSYMSVYRNPPRASNIARLYGLTNIQTEEMSLRRPPSQVLCVRFYSSPENKDDSKGIPLSEFERVLKENGELRAQFVSATEKELFNLWRFIIDDFKESFPQPYEEDFEEKKVKFHVTKLRNKVSFDLYEERRRQKWLYYCENPPNERMRSLVQRLKNENVDFEVFSEGIAKAYRLLSDKFHSSFIQLVMKDPKQYFLYKRVAIAIRVLLREEDILDALIDTITRDPMKK